MFKTVLFTRVFLYLMIDLEYSWISRRLRIQPFTVVKAVAFVAPLFTFYPIVVVPVRARVKEYV